MQNFVPHKRWYQINKIDGSTYSKEVYERYEKLRLYTKLRTEGCSERIALEASRISRSTYYRWNKRYSLAGLEVKSKAPKNRRKPIWTQKTERIVVEARRKYCL